MIEDALQATVYLVAFVGLIIAAMGIGLFLDGCRRDRYKPWLEWTGKAMLAWVLLWLAIFGLQNS